MKIGGLPDNVLISSSAAESLVIQVDSYSITYGLHFPNESTEKSLESLKEKIQLLKIEELIGVISAQNRKLTKLLKEKSRVLDKIQASLDFRVYAKVPFNEVQMDSFTHFTGFYNYEAGALQGTLVKIDANKGLMAAKKELLQKEANYTSIIDELTSFSNNLSDAIRRLHGIIELGYNTLQIL